MMPAGVQERGAGAAGYQVADVHGMETVGVFIGGYGFEHAARIDVFRERHLHQDAVDAGAGVQVFDHRYQFFGGGGFGGRFSR